MWPKDSAGPFREDIPKMFADKNLDGVVIYEADNIMWGDPNDANNLLKVLNNLFTGRCPIALQRSFPNSRLLSRCPLIVTRE